MFSVNQGAESEAIEPVRKILHQLDERRKLLLKNWDEKEKLFKRKLETIQIMNERNQINRDLDLLMQEVENRKKKIGTTVEQVQRNVETFSEITDNMNVNIN